MARALGILSPAGQGVELIPLWPKPDACAKRVIVRMRMNSKAPMLLHAGLVLHAADGTSTADAEAILRQGQPLFT
jgi:tRNA1(Val) A37 N6-methylase TrmN6